MKQELTVGGILSNGISIGVENIGGLLGAIILWLLTLWIPYLNVGTTIGLVGIVAKMGRGNKISPTDIFDGHYRKQMGEFFLVLIFVTMGTLVGCFFLIVPGIVISIAWSLAVLLVVDKGVDPMDAIHQSNKLTYGKKWTIFFAWLVIHIAYAALEMVARVMGRQTDMAVYVVLVVCLMIVNIAVSMGMFAFVYNSLVGDEATESLSGLD